MDSRVQRLIPLFRTGVACSCPSRSSDVHVDTCPIVQNATEAVRILSMYCPCGHIVDAHRRESEGGGGCTVGHSTVFPKPDVPPCACRAVFP